LRRWTGTGWIALFAITATVACSIDDFVEYGGVIGVDDGASEGTFKSVVVDGSQEERIELKTGASITIPEDAVETVVEIGMQRPADEKAVALVKSLKDYQAIVSAPYVLTPHGTKFREPVIIEIPVNKQTDKKLVVGWLENESDKKWKMLGVPVVKDGVAKLEIDHFSVVILLEEERANLASDEDAGSNNADAGNTGPGGGAPLDGGNLADPMASADAAKPAGAFDAGSGPVPYDAGPFVDKDGAFFPFPFPDAAASDTGTPSGGYDAGAPYMNDAGAGTPVDAGVSDSGKGQADAGYDAASGDAG
jgi:hypothetical protein